MLSSKDPTLTRLYDDLVVRCTMTDMHRSGYENIRHYAGGKQEWVKAGLATEGRSSSGKEIR